MKRNTGNTVGLGLLLALLIALGLTVPVSAGGLVLTTGTPGVAGLQVDAVQLSPAPPRSTGPLSVPRTYLVQPGDTLSGIAASFKLYPSVLIARNALTSPDQLQAGQVLQVDASLPPQPSLPPDSPLTRVQFWPWPPVQGQTLVVWLQARTPVTYSLSLAGQSYPVVSHGRRGWALIPFRALAVPASKPLTLTVGQASVSMAIPLEAGVFDFQQIPASVSDVILSHADQVRAEAARLATLYSVNSAFGWTPRSRFRSPLPPGGAYWHTSPYGTRRIYGNNPTLTFHSGEDFSAAPGTPVLAPAAGVVVLAEPLFVRGNAVVIDHGHGVFTGYWHLSVLNVKRGDHVKRGQLLGEVGSTGLSTGAHLHWELRVNGVAVNPLQWLAP